MRILGPIVCAKALVVATAQSERSAGAPVRAEPVGDEDRRRKALLAKKLAHQPHRGLRIPPPLDQHVQDFAFLVDGAPEPKTLATNADHHLVEMPG